MYLVIIKADYNDGDYCYKTHEFNEHAFEKLKLILKKLPRDFYGIHWNEPRNDYVQTGTLTVDEYEYINGMLPCPPDDSEIHTITSVKYYVCQGEGTVII